MMQTVAMAQAGVMPLLFSDTLIDQYLRAVVSYYETGQYSPYVAFFKANYALTIARLSGAQ